jgi:hypothetical protein
MIETADAETPEVATAEAEAAAVGTMHVIAEELRGLDLNIFNPEWDQTHFLKIENLYGALCEITIDASGRVAWEYRQVHGYHSGPAELAGMVLELLGGSSSEAPATSPGRHAGLTLGAAAGMALRACGMKVRLGTVGRNESMLGVYADVEVTNPARPDRGRVQVSDDGVIRWECRFSDPARDAKGIEPGEIARTLARSLPRVCEQQTA